MDKQRELYARQHTLHQNQVDYSPQLLKRDQFVLDRISKYNHKKIGELSVGEGRLSRELVRNFPESHLSFYELDETRIAELEKSIPNDGNLNLTFCSINFDTEFSKIQANEFDVLIALDILEHVVDVFGFVENCARVLKPGGILFLRVPNIGFIRHRINLALGKLPITSSWYGERENLEGWYKNGWDGGHLHYFTINLLDELIIRHNFETIEVNDAGANYESLRKISPQLLFANPLYIVRRS